MEAMLGSAVVGGVMCAGIVVVAKWKWKGVAALVGLFVIGSWMGF